jgi:S1-C subfamily serine protease
VSFERTVPHDVMPPSVADRFASVVLFEVSNVEPNYYRPWQKFNQGSCTGTGFAISGRRILTNCHVTAHATDIRLRKHGHSKRYAAQVVCEGQDVDLAVVEVTEDADDFWDGVPEVTWSSELPVLQSSVNVVGFPTGGRTICVTEGVVSRVDCSNYRLGASAAANPGLLLVVQIDAAINGGNSGGPVFNTAGDVAGVAFQGLGGDAQNVGYVIPAAVARNFLERVEGVTTSSMYVGVQEVPFRWATLQNKALRAMLGVAKGVSGVVVTAVSPLVEGALVEGALGEGARVEGGGDGEGALAGGALEPALGGATAAAAAAAGGGEGAAGARGFLLPDDVVTHIDGRVVGDDFTVPLRRDELVLADFLVTGKRAGQPTTFDVLRAGQRLRVRALLRALPAVLPRTHGLDCDPVWQLVGGLLFVPLVCPLVDCMRGLSPYVRHRSASLMRAFRSRADCEAGSELILLVAIMACDANFGYTHEDWRVLQTVNGRPVRSMLHLHQLYAGACAGAAERGEGSEWRFLQFGFSDESRVVLETAACVATESAVLATNAIPSAAAPQLVAKATARAEVEAEAETADAGGAKAGGSSTR